VVQQYFSKSKRFFKSSSLGSTKNPILWGEATKVGEQLFWCEGNATVAVPVAVSGNTSEPFFLISYPEESPNLKAVSVTSSIPLKTVFCMHTPEIIEKCKTGNRTRVLSPLQKFKDKYQIKIE